MIIVNKKKAMIFIAKTKGGTMTRRRVRKAVDDIPIDGPQSAWRHRRGKQELKKGGWALRLWWRRQR